MYIHMYTVMLIIMYNTLCHVHNVTEQLVTIAATTGIVLDPTYTLKGVQGLLGELEKNPGRFKGKRILHIHTGNQ